MNGRYLIFCLLTLSSLRAGEGGSRRTAKQDVVPKTYTGPYVVAVSVLPKKTTCPYCYFKGTDAELTQHIRTEHICKSRH